MVAEKTLDVRFISGQDQLADILTKPLTIARFILLKSNLKAKVIELD